MSGATNCPLDTYDVLVWNVKVGGKYFIGNRDESRTVTFRHPKDLCSVCYVNEEGLRLSCGHFVCPDDILNQAWCQIKVLKHEINCPACPSIIGIDDIIKFGLPKDDEKQFLTTAISVNFCESQDIKQCPNCYSYCQRIDSNSPLVNCSACTERTGKSCEFCWDCLKVWRGKSNKDCGNPNCKTSVLETLRNSDKKVFRDKKGKEILSARIRACPRCFTLLEHKERCNEMTCTKCGEEFCFICLSTKRDESLFCKGRTYSTLTCIPAPVQRELPL